MLRAQDDGPLAGNPVSEVLEPLHETSMADVPSYCASSAETSAAPQQPQPPTITVAMVARMPDEPDPYPFLSGPLSVLNTAWTLPSCHANVRANSVKSHPPPPPPPDMDPQMILPEPQSSRQQSVDEHLEEAYRAANQLSMFFPPGRDMSVTERLRRCVAIQPTQEKKEKLIRRTKEWGLKSIAADLERFQRAGLSERLFDSMVASRTWREEIEEFTRMIRSNALSWPERSRSATPRPPKQRRAVTELPPSYMDATATPGPSRIKTVEFGQATQVHLGDQGVVQLRGRTASRESGSSLPPQSNRELQEYLDMLDDMESPGLSSDV